MSRIILKTLSEYRNIRLRMYAGEASGVRYWLDSLITEKIEDTVHTESRFFWSNKRSDVEAEFDFDVKKQKQIEQVA